MSHITDIFINPQCKFLFVDHVEHQFGEVILARIVINNLCSKGIEITSNETFRIFEGEGDHYVRPGSIFNLCSDGHITIGGTRIASVKLDRSIVYVTTIKNISNPKKRKELSTQLPVRRSEIFGSDVSQISVKKKERREGSTNEFIELKPIERFDQQETYNGLFAPEPGTSQPKIRKIITHTKSDTVGKVLCGWFTPSFVTKDTVLSDLIEPPYSEDASDDFMDENEDVPTVGDLKRNPEERTISVYIPRILHSSYTESDLIRYLLQNKYFPVYGPSLVNETYPPHLDNYCSADDLQTHYGQYKFYCNLGTSGLVKNTRMLEILRTDDISKRIAELSKNYHTILRLYYNERYNLMYIVVLYSRSNITSTIVNYLYQLMYKLDTKEKKSEYIHIFYKDKIHTKAITTKFGLCFISFDGGKYYMIVRVFETNPDDYPKPKPKSFYLMDNDDHIVLECDTNFPLPSVELEKNKRLVFSVNRDGATSYSKYTLKDFELLRADADFSLMKRTSTFMYISENLQFKPPKSANLKSVSDSPIDPWLFCIHDNEYKIPVTGTILDIDNGEAYLTSNGNMDKIDSINVHDYVDILRSNSAHVFSNTKYNNSKILRYPYIGSTKRWVSNDETLLDLNQPLFHKDMQIIHFNVSKKKKDLYCRHVKKEEIEVKLNEAVIVQKTTEIASFTWYKTDLQKSSGTCTYFKRSENEKDHTYEYEFYSYVRGKSYIQNKEDLAYFSKFDEAKNELTNDDKSKDLLFVRFYTDHKNGLCDISGCSLGACTEPKIELTGDDDDIITRGIMGVNIHSNKGEKLYFTPFEGLIYHETDNFDDVALYCTCTNINEYAHSKATNGLNNPPPPVQHVYRTVSMYLKMEYLVEWECITLKEQTKGNKLSSNVLMLLEHVVVCGVKCDFLEHSVDQKAERSMEKINIKLDCKMLEDQGNGTFKDSVALTISEGVDGTELYFLHSLTELFNLRSNVPVVNIMFRVTGLKTSIAIPPDDLSYKFTVCGMEHVVSGTVFESGMDKRLGSLSIGNVGGIQFIADLSKNSLSNHELVEINRGFSDFSSKEKVFYVCGSTMPDWFNDDFINNPSKSMLDNRLSINGIEYTSDLSRVVLFCGDVISGRDSDSRVLVIEKNTSINFDNRVYEGGLIVWDQTKLITNAISTTQSTSANIEDVRTVNELRNLQQKVNEPKIANKPMVFNHLVKELSENHGCKQVIRSVSGVYYDEGINGHVWNVWNDIYVSVLSDIDVCFMCFIASTHNDDAYDWSEYLASEQTSAPLVTRTTLDLEQPPTNSLERYLLVDIIKNKDAYGFVPYCKIFGKKNGCLIQSGKLSKTNNNQIYDIGLSINDNKRHAKKRFVPKHACKIVLVFCINKGKKTPMSPEYDMYVSESNLHFATLDDKK